MVLGEAPHPNFHPVLFHRLVVEHDLANKRNGRKIKNPLFELRPTDSSLEREDASHQFILSGSQASTSASSGHSEAWGSGPSNEGSLSPVSTSPHSSRIGS
jgi:hypothetical protein